MRLKPAALGLFIGLSAAGLAAAHSAKDLSVGQVIRTDPGETINGWIHVASGLFWRRQTSKFVTTETMECCFAVFERSDALLIARTVPLSRNAKGGVLTERVDWMLKVSKQAGEISVADCPILWITPAWTLLNERTRAARSFVVTSHGIEQVRWIDDRQNCASGE